MLNIQEVRARLQGTKFLENIQSESSADLMDNIVASADELLKRASAMRHWQDDMDDQYIVAAIVAILEHPRTGVNDASLPLLHEDHLTDDIMNAYPLNGWSA